MSKTKTARIIRPKTKRSVENIKSEKAVTPIVDKPKSSDEDKSADAVWSGWNWWEEKGLFYRARKVKGNRSNEFAGPELLLIHRAQTSGNMNIPLLKYPLALREEKREYSPMSIEYPKEDTKVLYVEEPQYTYHVHTTGSGEYVLAPVVEQVTTALGAVAHATTANSTVDITDNGKIQKENLQTEKVNAEVVRDDDDDDDEGLDKEGKRGGRKTGRVDRVDEWRKEVKEALHQTDGKAKKKHGEKEKRHKDRR